MGRWICHGSPTAGAVLFLEVCGPFLFNVTEASTLTSTELIPGPELSTKWHELKEIVSGASSIQVPVPSNEDHCGPQNSRLYPRPN